MQKITSVFFKSITALFLLVISFSQGFAQKITSMDEGWKFHFGNAADPDKDFNYSLSTVYAKSGVGEGTAIDARFDDKDWRSLDLPHDWVVELPFASGQNIPDAMKNDLAGHGYKPVGGLFPETSIGWYRKHFAVARADSGNRFIIQFDGIYRNATIWINGFFVGTNMSGYMGASYDISDYINFDKENVLVVRVDATQYEGWFYEGAGIYRHVWLREENNIHFTEGGVFVYTDMQTNRATVNIEATVVNQNLDAAKCSVYSYITERNGTVIGKTKEEPLSLAVNGTGFIKQKLTVANPHLWELEDPYLYRVITVIKSGNSILQSTTNRIGVRSFRIDVNDGLFMNGKHIKIQGVCNHQDHAGVGTAMPDYLQYYRVQLLKNMGVNACRTSHNPPTPEFLEACDSLGMLVLDENRLLNSSPSYKNDFEKLIKRDRNHPSVFMWSIANEEFAIQSTTYGKRIAQTLVTLQKELDPSRTCTYASDLGNVYKGANEVMPVRGFNYRQYAVADYHKDHPDQPILGTEMGSTVTSRGIYEKDTIRCYVPDQDITAPWWATTAETWWKLAAANNYWMGGFVWTGFDYRGEPTPFQWPNINSHFGIMDMCGFPKNIYYYYQSWWTDKDVLHISPHWNWMDKRGQPIDVWVNSNADNVELFLNGISLGKKDMPRNGHLQWSVNYEPGKLEAVADKKGRVFKTSVETTGPAAEVVLTPYKTTMLADGKDAAVINVSVIDREGREVPDANNMIRFYISGDAKVIGVGNGDPSCHEPDKCADGAWQRSAFNGKCQVIIQAGKTPGIIKFEAKAAGLWTGSTDIITVTPQQVATVTIDKKYELKGEAAKPREATKMIGADISFLPQLEDRGMKFSDNGMQKDAILILKDHGFNYIRLRIFDDPSRDSGYAPGKGYCDLAHTLQMAKRIKAAGLKFLLDFHYSDYWADPGKQFKPAAWKNLNFDELKQALYDYTNKVMTALKDQGTTPDMVQVGNEINHGIVWPDGNISNIDNLAQLVNAGIAAVKSVDPSVVIMLHIALGGQNDESVFFIDNMLARGVQFDVVGESYYPKWHGTLDDLRYNLTNLVQRYNKDVIVVEYSQHKEEVNKIAFELPNGKGKGTCIWEPLSTWEAFFDKQGNSTDLLRLYDDINKKYVTDKKE